MVRPSKSVDTMSKNLTKEEYALRKGQEARLKGKNDNISPSEHLSDTQKQIFAFIVQELKESGILSNLDVFVLDSISIAVDRLRWIDGLINNDPNNMFNKEILQARKQFMDDFKRLSSELSLSPQSRAKIGSINVQAKQQETDPLLQVLSGGKT